MTDPAELQRFRHPFKGFRALSGLTAVVFLAACSAGPSTPTGSAAPTASTGPPVYASTTFVVPFDVGPPGWLDPKPTTEQSNFVTWEAPGDPHVPAVRFLVPVNVYPPGGNGTTEPPQDYLAYLLDQTSHGAHFTDQAQRTVGDQPATILTATVDNSLDGSLGCPAADTAASDCFGLQPDLALRMAVVRVRERTLLIWLRTDSRMDETDKKSKIQAFENMLQTIRFSDRSVQPPTTSVVNSNPIFAVVARYSPKSLGLSKPANLAIGPDGSFYITDASQRVSVVSRQGKVLRRWGHRGSGPGEFSFVSSVAAIAVAANGNVYVADSGNSRIEVFNPRGKFLRQFGSGGVGNGLPLAIAVDRDGSAYVTNDKEQTVSKFSERGGLKWTRGGNSETDPDLVGHFHFASLDSHNRLVMANDDAARVVYLDMNGQKVDAFGSPGDFPEGPCDVTVDSAGETFVGSCVSPYSLQAFNASHQLVGTSSPSGLAWVPRFGPHNQVVALADDGSVMSLRMKLPKK